MEHPSLVLFTDVEQGPTTFVQFERSIKFGLLHLRSPELSCRSSKTPYWRSFLNGYTSYTHVFAKGYLGLSCYSQHNPFMAFLWYDYLGFSLIYKCQQCNTRKKRVSKSDCYQTRLFLQKFLQGEPDAQLNSCRQLRSSNKLISFNFLQVDIAS